MVDCFVFATKQMNDSSLIDRGDSGERHARSFADQLCLVGDDYLPSYQSVAVDRIRFLGRS